MQYISTFAIAITFLMSVLILFYIPQAYGVFHREDFLITDLGIRNGIPFMTVQGEAGRSFSVDKGDESYYAYTFLTDKGVFASTVAVDEDGTAPYYGVDSFKTDKFEIMSCLEEGTTTGEPRFYGKTVEYIPKELVIGNVSKAYAIQVTLDDPDENCESGNYILKIF